MNENELALAFWDRAEKAQIVARHDLQISPDAAASRAYYAAFYAVSALFALEGRTFRKHSALEAAVHHDLVKMGLGRYPARRRRDAAGNLHRAGGRLTASARHICS